MIANGEGNGTPLQYSCLGNPMDGGAWWAAVHGVAKSWTQLNDFTFTFHFHAFEKEMATHSSCSCLENPRYRGHGGLPSMGSHRVGHDWHDLAAAAAWWLKKWLSNPWTGGRYFVFLPGISYLKIIMSLKNGQAQKESSYMLTVLGGKTKNIWWKSVHSFSCVRLFVTPWPHWLQHTRLPCPSPTSAASSNSCPLSQWCHPTISFFFVPFSTCLQSFPASGSFQMSQFFASGGQRIGASASASVLPMNTQDWSPLGWTGWIFLQSKGCSRVFSNTTVQKHQFFSTQLPLWSNSHIHTWPLEKSCM